MPAAEVGPAAQLLRSKMSDLSETCWAAGWLDGLEFSLWAMVTADESKYGEWGLGYVPSETLAELAALSAIADGCAARQQNRLPRCPLRGGSRLPLSVRPRPLPRDTALGAARYGQDGLALRRSPG